MIPRTSLDRLASETPIVAPDIGALGWRGVVNASWSVGGWIVLASPAGRPHALMGPHLVEQRTRIEGSAAKRLAAQR